MVLDFTKYKHEKEEFNLSEKRHEIENELIKRGLQIPEVEIVMDLIENQDKEFIEKARELLAYCIKSECDEEYVLNKFDQLAGKD